MFKILKKKQKAKKDAKCTPTCTYTSDDAYDDLDPPDKPNPQEYMPLLPETPIPKPPSKKILTGKIFNEEAIVDLPLQHMSLNKRMEDLSEDECGYELNQVQLRSKKKEPNWEEAFVDATDFVPFDKDSKNPMINKFFCAPSGDYKFRSIQELIKEAEQGLSEQQQDIKRYITMCLLPKLKKNKNIGDIFKLLCCKQKDVRNLCINDLTDLIMTADIKSLSSSEVMDFYGVGTTILFSVMSETKRTAVTFQQLIQLGIIFNCLVYLRAINDRENWTECIEKIKKEIKPNSEKLMRRGDVDVDVFQMTENCIFNLQDLDIDESSLMDEDMNDFLPLHKSNIPIEGLALLYHSGNLVMRRSIKFQPGVKRMEQLANFMDDCPDETQRKWYNRLLGSFIVRLLQEEHPDVKKEMLEKYEDDLLSTLSLAKLQPDITDIPWILLFHSKERIRLKYQKYAESMGLKFSNTEIEKYIEYKLDKFEVCFSMPDTNNIYFERQQCTFLNSCASVTCLLGDLLFDQKSQRNSPLYDNTYSSIKVGQVGNSSRKNNLENELELLKELHSENYHRNVARLLSFNQSIPKFYIKERLPGDNLQRRLLEARDSRKIIPIEDLLDMIVQAVAAVIYVHSQECLVRDITTASFGCEKTNDKYFLKLKNFEMALKSSEFPSGGILGGLSDFDFEGVPTRWAAPESLLYGRYSIYSDVWSVNILADEILNYAAWPYSDISDLGIDKMVINIVFTHLKPQGFNRPRRVQSLILAGLADTPEQRLKLEALMERILDIKYNLGGGDGCDDYETYSGVDGSNARNYEIPPLSERQIKENSVHERGIPPSIKRYRSTEEDPGTAFRQEMAERTSELQHQEGITMIEISSDENYRIDSEGFSNMLKVKERISSEFLRFTYNRLGAIQAIANNACVTPWPPTTSVLEDGSVQMLYKIPKGTHLLDMCLHKELEEISVIPYIQLLYELASHIDCLHSAGWIFRCLRAKNIWIINSKKSEHTIIVPKFGKYRFIASAETGDHLEQLKIGKDDYTDGIQWLPIEAIKARLYSKESDVYAFGMITWEVMSALGQQGVMYNQDEERELKCIPFNYHHSENILEHLIEGYLPEKPVKCPDWFYKEVTRPCLLHQKIDRPSMKIVLQTLDMRLGKSIPRQIPLGLTEGYDNCKIKHDSEYEIPQPPPPPKRYYNIKPSKTRSSRKQPIDKVGLEPPAQLQVSFDSSDDESYDLPEDKITSFIPLPNERDQYKDDSRKYTNACGNQERFQTGDPNAVFSNNLENKELPVRHYTNDTYQDVVYEPGNLGKMVCDSDKTDTNTLKPDFVNLAKKETCSEKKNTKAEYMNIKSTPPVPPRKPIK